MKKTSIIFVTIFFSIIAIGTFQMLSCEKSDSTTNTNTPTATCTDGIQNQGETGIDCGGPCPPCTPVNTSGTLTFNVYQICAGFSSVILNGASVTIYNNQTDLNNGDWSYYNYTQGNGTVTFNNLTPKTYYYKVYGEINSGKCFNVSRSETGTVIVNAGTTTTKTVTLTQ
jgi:hypothetical protein